MSPKVIVSRPEDLPPAPCSMGGMDWNPTGLWRYLTPTPRDKAAPCFSACPAGNPIPQLMDLLAQGREDDALELLLENNPLPGVTGRLCFHPCQRDCLRGTVDRNLPVQVLERWTADHGAAAMSPPQTRGARAAVMGAGPVGLTCAYLLGRQGIEVTLYDPCPKAGGFLRNAKGLSAAVLDREVSRLVQISGIKIELKSSCAEQNVRAGGREPNMVIVDQYAHNPGTREAKVLAAAWPCNGESDAGMQLLRPEMEPGFKGFRPVLAAQAVGLGRELAHKALAILGGREPDRPQTLEPVSADDVNFGLFEPESPVRKAPARPDRERVTREAGRCMSCGACNLCQKCVLFCPDACWSLDGQAGLQVDLEHCKGCGICAQECPRGVIGMEAPQ